jgi:hypothetical protein
MNDDPFRPPDNSLAPEKSFTVPPADTPFVREVPGRGAQPYAPEAEFVRPHRRPTQQTAVPASTNPDASAPYTASGDDAPIPFADKPPTADEDPEQSATSTKLPAHTVAQRAVAETVSLSKGGEEEVIFPDPKAIEPDSEGSQAKATVPETPVHPAADELHPEESVADATTAGEELTAPATDEAVSLAEPFAAPEQEPIASDRFTVRYTDGTVRLRDPFTGDILRPDEVPPSLLEDKGIREGLNFWDEHGPEVKFKLLPTAHGHISDLDKWGIDLRSEAQRLARVGGVLFVEALKTPEEAEYLLGFLREVSSWPEYEKNAAPGWIQGHVASGKITPIFGGIAERILGTKTDIEIADFQRNGPRPADKLLTVWNSRIRQIEDGGNSMGGAVALLEHWVGYDHTRDMNFVGRMGGILADRHQSGRVSEAAFLEGVAHVNVGRHLAARNVQVTQPDLRTKNMPDFVRKVIEWNTKVEFNLHEADQLLRRQAWGS